MTQIFSGDGKVFPATIVSAGPIIVTQLKNIEKDGYSAVQVGYGKKNRKNIKKAQMGHSGKLGLFRFLKEFRFDNKSDFNSEFKVGDSIDVSIFEVGDNVTVASTSKGKGFQGVIKRHGFHGGPRSHGQKHTERSPGSIGSTGPQRVFKGTKMAGRMGSDRVTVKNLKVLQVNKKDNMLVLSGSIPGKRGTLVEVISR